MVSINGYAFEDKLVINEKLNIDLLSDINLELLVQRTNKYFEHEKVKNEGGNIKLNIENGTSENKIFDGTLSISDLKLDFTGSGSLEEYESDSGEKFQYYLLYGTIDNVNNDSISLVVHYNVDTKETFISATIGCLGDNIGIPALYFGKPYDLMKEFFKSTQLNEKSDSIVSNDDYNSLGEISILSTGGLVPRGGIAALHNGVVVGRLEVESEDGITNGQANISQSRLFSYIDNVTDIINDLQGFSGAYVISNKVTNAYSRLIMPTYFDSTGTCIPLNSVTTWAFPVYLGSFIGFQSVTVTSSQTTFTHYQHSGYYNEGYWTFYKNSWLPAETEYVSNVEYRKGINVRMKSTYQGPATYETLNAIAKGTLKYTAILQDGITQFSTTYTTSEMVKDFNVKNY